MGEGVPRQIRLLEPALQPPEALALLQGVAGDVDKTDDVLRGTGDADHRAPVGAPVTRAVGLCCRWDELMCGAFFLGEWAARTWPDLD
jgi:hypothetical protein